MPAPHGASVQADHCPQVKPRPLRNFGLICGIAFCGAAVAVWQNARPATAPSLPFGLLSGDIVLLEGNSWRANVVRLFGSGSSDYSHAGIAVSSADGWMIAHADPKRGCVCDRWSDVLSAHDVVKVAVYRSSSLSTEQRNLVAKSAASFVAKGVPFDNAFDGGNADSLYCTEMIARAFETVGQNELLDQCVKGPLFPECLTNFHDFKPVANPFP